MVKKEPKKVWSLFGYLSVNREWLFRLASRWPNLSQCQTIQNSILEIWPSDFGQLSVMVRLAEIQSSVNRIMYYAFTVKSCIMESWRKSRSVNRHLTEFAVIKTWKKLCLNHFQFLFHLNLSKSFHRLIQTLIETSLLICIFHSIHIPISTSISTLL